MFTEHRLDEKILCYRVFLFLRLHQRVTFFLVGQSDLNSISSGPYILDSIYTSDCCLDK